LDGADFNLYGQLKINIGTTWIRPFLIWADDARTIPNPLTGLVSSSLQVFDSTGDVMLSLNGTISSGQIVYQAEIAQTSTVVPGRYYYKIQHTYNTGHVYPFLKGHVDAA